MNVEAPRLPPVGNQSPVHSTSSHPVITAGSIPLLQGCDLDKDVTSLSKSSQCLNRPVIITGPRPLGALPPPGALGALSLPTTGTPSQARTGSGIPPATASRHRLPAVGKLPTCTIKAGPAHQALGIYRIKPAVARQPRSDPH